MPRAAPDHLLGIDRGGLSQAQAKHRLEVDGPNALPDPQRHSVWGLLGELLREPMLALLMACGVVYLALGDAAEAALLIGFSFVVIAVTLFQRRVPWSFEQESSSESPHLNWWLATGSCWPRAIGFRLMASWSRRNISPLMNPL